MTKTLVPCGFCGGTGKTVLSSCYERTLNLVRKRGEATGATLAKIDGCQATAMNNRLKMLQKHGLLIARRDGRQVFYRIL